MTAPARAVELRLSRTFRSMPMPPSSPSPSPRAAPPRGRQASVVLAALALAALDAWAKRARAWAAGEAAPDLEHVGEAMASGSGRDVFLYVISGAKARNPAAAMALIERLLKGLLH